MKRAWQILAVSALAIVAAIAITTFWASKANAPKEVLMDSHFQLASPAFADGDAIPVKYTCKGIDTSPPLTFKDVPAGTVSLALIMHDPDAPNGDFLHWTMWNMPPDIHNLAEGTVPDGSVQGANGFGKNAYGGPCPPSGTHHYIFDLYALDTDLDLSAGSSRGDVQQAIDPHVIAQTRLTGTFSAD